MIWEVGSGCPFTMVDAADIRESTQGKPEVIHKTWYSSRRFLSLGTRISTKLPQTTNERAPDQAAGAAHFANHSAVKERPGPHETSRGRGRIPGRNGLVSETRCAWC